MILVTLCMIAGGCATLPGTGEEPSNDRRDGPENRFSLYLQKPAEGDIHSIQLHRENAPSTPPVIRMNKNEQLVLSFDQIKTGSSRFLIRVVHYSKQWSRESPISPDFYLGGFYETYFSGGSKSFAQRPDYWHYEYRFPNAQLNFRTSGNYLLSVFEADSRNLLFSLPFFVSENAGELSTRAEPLFAGREDMRRREQLFSTYRYPDFVEMPRFDLSFVYVQNQFWGRSREADVFDTATQGAVNAHLSRSHAFISDYQFNLLSMPSVTTSGTQIVETITGDIPPRVILRRDVQQLSTLAGRAPGSRFGIPESGRNARYAQVQFRFEAGTAIPSYRDLYIVGDFNQWMIQEENQMRYDQEDNLWKGTAMVKEGTYAYKYVIVDGNRIDDTTLDPTLASQTQEYMTFVYFRDPVRHYDRLLRVHRMR